MSQNRNEGGSKQANFLVGFDKNCIIVPFQLKCSTDIKILRDCQFIIKMRLIIIIYINMNKL